jgi:hypothetical protein
MDRTVATVTTVNPANPERTCMFGLRSSPVFTRCCKFAPRVAGTSSFFS